MVIIVVVVIMMMMIGGHRETNATGFIVQFKMGIKSRSMEMEETSGFPSMETLLLDSPQNGISVTARKGGDSSSRKGPRGCLVPCESLSIKK